MLNLSVKKDISAVPKRIGQMTKLGQYGLVNQVHADSNNYVPMLSSDMRNQSTIALDGKSIIWNVPYARRHYHTQFSKYTTPNTGPYWDKKAKAIHMKSWERVAKNAMR